MSRVVQLVHLCMFLTFIFYFLKETITKTDKKDEETSVRNLVKLIDKSAFVFSTHLRGGLI